MSKRNETKSDYPDFFRDHIYAGFVEYLIDKFGAGKVIAITGDEPIVTKKGVHIQLRKSFNEFLSLNPKIEKKFADNRQKCMSLRNTCGGTLYFPVDPGDNTLMVKLKYFSPDVIPVLDDIPRASNKIKKIAGPMKGQLLKGEWKERPYHSPELLVIHYKRGYAQSIKKTTESFRVASRTEATNLIFNVYEGKVAFAQLGKTEKFQFVKRNARKKKKKQHHGSV